MQAVDGHFAGPHAARAVQGEHRVSSCSCWGLHRMRLAVRGSTKSSCTAHTEQQLHEQDTGNSLPDARLLIVLPHPCSLSSVAVTPCWRCLPRSWSKPLLWQPQQLRQRLQQQRQQSPSRGTYSWWTS